VRLSCLHRARIHHQNLHRCLHQPVHIGFQRHVQTPLPG